MLRLWAVTLKSLRVLPAHCTGTAWQEAAEQCLQPRGRGRLRLHLPGRQFVAAEGGKQTPILPPTEEGKGMLCQGCGQSRSREWQEPKAEHGKWMKGANAEISRRRTLVFIRLLHRHRGMLGFSPWLPGKPSL